MGALKPMGPAGKGGIVLLGLAIALALACLAIAVRQHFTQGPDAQAASGMYAGGDMFLGIAVFGVVALVPLALGLYWLRSNAEFWSLLTGSAVVFAVTGPVAMALIKWSPPSHGIWLLLDYARIGATPFTAVAFVACALFAPSARQRWTLLTTACAEGVIFSGIVLVHFIVPQLGG